ncbi:Transcription factor BTF3 [Fasciola hepatica]|uniref:Transcription factor BTF3 n=1 Tax=Fasciola hepatica TaxID=6192 RepID=A0A4E0QZB0_FASHE|nr:Transcription factor BTF3 [Fasciola hepatica]
MDVEKARQDRLEKLRNMSDQVRIGGKGTARRKKKVVHKNAVVDDKKLQGTLKKLNLNTIPTIEEADGTMIHFKNPKVQASPQANVFAVSGQAENKALSDLFPSMLNQLESAKLRLCKMNENSKGEGETKPEDFDEEVPDLVEDFDEKSRLE